MSSGEGEGRLTFFRDDPPTLRSPPQRITRGGERLRQDADARTAPGPARLPLCDFSQSRLLINFQIINVKVRVTPFHSGAADKSVPHQHSRQVAPGQADTRGLNPKPRPPATAAPVMPRQFQSGRKSMPSKSTSSTAGGGGLLIACEGAGQEDGVHSP